MLTILGNWTKCKNICFNFKRHLHSVSYLFSPSLVCMCVCMCKAKRFLMPISLTVFCLRIKALVPPFTKHHSHSTPVLNTLASECTCPHHTHTLTFMSHDTQSPLLCFGHDATRCKRADSWAEDWGNYNLIYLIIDTLHFTQRQRIRRSRSREFLILFLVFYFIPFAADCRMAFHWEYKDFMWCITLSCFKLKTDTKFCAVCYFSEGKKWSS